MTEPRITQEASGAGGIGIIIPPPTRKTIIDKTAAFVAKTGRHVEEEILSRPQGSTAANFTFLLEDDPFHAYYLSKVAELQSGPIPSASSSTANSTAEVPAAPVNTTATSSKTVIAEPALRATSLVDALRSSSKKKGQEPPPFEFFLEKPSDVSSGMLSLIKITAQFAASDGKKFEADLYHKEKLNTQEYGFLNSNHPHHSYYAELVRCYRKIIEGNILWLSELAKSEKVLLERAVHRFEFRRDEALKRLETDEKRALERMAFLEIDWHDFVVVETIRFEEDEYEQRSEEVVGIERLVLEAADAARNAVSADDTDELGEIRYGFNVEPVRASLSVPMVPLADGRQVPVTELNEHRRVELLDPRWRENQERFEARQKDTNLAEGGSMPKYLARMAGNRPDVFGGEREDAERRWEEKKRKRESETVAWDGNLLSADSVKAAAANYALNQGVTPQVFVPGARPLVQPLRAAFPPVIAPPMPRAVADNFPPPPPVPSNTESQDNSKRSKIEHIEPGMLKVIVPAGGPGGLGACELSIPYNAGATVNDVKELISAALSNVAVSKFQLKLSDGRFLKNTDIVEPIVELKWKSR